MCEINGFSDALFWRQPTALLGLPEGTHEAELRMVSGRAFDVEVVDVIARVAPLQAGTHEADTEGLLYLGAWEATQFEDAPPELSRGKRSRTPRALVYFSFEGSRVELLLPGMHDRGTVELCVDGTCRDVRLNRPGDQPQLEWHPSPKLNRGLHHVELRKRDGRYLELLGVRIAD